MKTELRMDHTALVYPDDSLNPSELGGGTVFGFYLNVLGFKVLPARDGAKELGIYWIQVDPAFDHQIHLVPMGASNGIAKKWRRVEHEAEVLGQQATTGIPHICLQTFDIKAWWDRLAEHGIEVYAPDDKGKLQPSAYDTLRTSIYFRDPYGYLWEINQREKSRKRSWRILLAVIARFFKGEL